MEALRKNRKECFKMIYILTGSLLILFFISYFGSGKDFFAPMTVQVMSFVFSDLMCIYFMKSFEAPYQFHWDSVTIIISCMAISVGIGILIHQMFRRIKIRSYTQAEIAVSPISNTVNAFVLAFVMLVIIWQILEVRSIGGTTGTLSEAMLSFHSLRYLSTTDEFDLPFLLRQFHHMVQVFCILYGFNLIRFYKGLSLCGKILDILIIGMCILCALLTGGRHDAVNQLIAFVMIFHLLRIQKIGVYKKYNIRFLIRIFIFLWLGLYAFAFLKEFVGRNQSLINNPLDYISYYTGTEFITFDMYLQDPPMPSRIFGKYTFYNLNQNLRFLGIANIPRYVGQLEFRSIGGGLRTNVYSVFRTYHYDFGMAGVYILHAIVSIFMSFFYEYTKKKCNNIAILTFSIMYYSIVLSFFAERFFSNIVCLTFLKRLIPLLILYELFIRKRIHFMIGTKHRLKV